MQVFTVPAAAMPPAIQGGNGNGASPNYSAGPMIQSQPINLAITNGVASRGSDTFEKVDGFRQDSLPSISATRSANQNHSEQQAQDLSMHAQQQQQQQPPPSPAPKQFQPEPVNNNTLLDFCNIILNYTNYPEGFHDEFKPITQALGGRRKVKPTPRSKVDLATGFARPPQKRKIVVTTTPTVKNKPGRKPKVPKLECPPAAAAGAASGTPPRLRAETVPGPNQSRQDENGTRGKVDENRMKGGRRRERKTSSPLNSVGESREGTHSSASSTSSHLDGRRSQGSNLFYPDDDRDESWDEVTCFCGKPFAGRPMIECENCFVWHHMSCARLRKANVPKKFYCRDCKPMFPDFVQEKQRRASGNNNTNNNSNGLGESVIHYAKATGKMKNGLSGAGAEVTTPLALTIPSPVHAPSSQSQQHSPPLSPSSSPHLTPQEGSNDSQLPSADEKAGPSSAVSAMSPSTAQQQLKGRQQPYLNGTSTPESKPVQTVSKSSSTPGQSPSKKSPEKPAKRRPTLNSASSGLYDDVVLALKIN